MRDLSSNKTLGFIPLGDQPLPRPFQSPTPLMIRYAPLTLIHILITLINN